MNNDAIEILIILGLILTNGIFSMSTIPNDFSVFTAPSMPDFSWAFLSALILYLSLKRFFQVF
jgi:hypothetical protein